MVQSAASLDTLSIEHLSGTEVNEYPRFRTIYRLTSKSRRQLRSAIQSARQAKTLPNFK